MTVKRPAAASDNLRKIFEATFRLANKTGFAAMSLRDLCRETGLSMGGLYGYIASKEDLAAMIEDVVRHVSAAIPLWFSAEPNALSRLDGTLRGHIFLSELLQPWFYFVFMESRLLSATQRAVAKASELHFQEELSRMVVDTGVSEEVQAQLIASHCMAMVQDWHVKRWKYRHQKIGVDAFANSVSDLVLRWTTAC
jgi:AcrR family transcriptional regulator